ncbi:SRPBCC domain-containing protein [Streptomyces sp. NPDC006638]|uniref:SRPBCC family protein n=1 Tax=Streptomyces sp. NPDC006638 TaxID=3157183 RepID=UPI0033ADC040
MTEEQTTADGFPYTLERVLEAPVAAVWNAWTTAEPYTQWSYAAPGTVEMDVRPGGKWTSTMVTPDGTKVPLTGSYAEVEVNRRLVVGMDVPGQDAQALMTVELAEQGTDGTRITVTQTCDTAEQRDMAEQGTTMLLDSLTAFLKTAS